MTFMFLMGFLKIRPPGYYWELHTLKKQETTINMNKKDWKPKFNMPLASLEKKYIESFIILNTRKVPIHPDNNPLINRAVKESLHFTSEEASSDQSFFLQSSRLSSRLRCFTNSLLLKCQGLFHTAGLAKTLSYSPLRWGETRFFSFTKPVQVSYPRINRWN